VIYPVDSIISLLNNPAQNNNQSCHKRLRKMAFTCTSEQTADFAILFSTNETEEYPKGALEPSSWRWLLVFLASQPVLSLTTLCNTVTYYLGPFCPILYIYSFASDAYFKYENDQHITIYKTWLSHTLNIMNFFNFHVHFLNLTDPDVPTVYIVCIM